MIRTPRIFLATGTALAGSHYVSDYRPADEDQGGDAFTIATLR